ncbi:hypothetical protein LCGC14_0353400 [marine sediment metagenome]|uniref:Phage Gp37Gp68 family protein n=1 Tax=marine sediment metagenome TaxID=412755 RepID=A0A0F9WI64_9ZZZZ
MPTKIEWTDKTWNPTTGCTKVGPGCANCFIVRTPPFYYNRRKFERVGTEMTTGVILHPERLEHPLKWRKPQRIFVNSLSDLFHEDVPDEFIDQVFAVMALAPQHTFQILTKRPERMVQWFAYSQAFRTRADRVSEALADWYGLDHEAYDPTSIWPFSNVHLYVSVENQYWADKRLPFLMQTPAAVRGVSYEPALKRVELSDYLDAGYESGGPQGWIPQPSLDHIIIGGESGPRARPFDIEWARSTVAQCKVAGVAVFVKQMGSVWAKENGIKNDPKGGNMQHWPEDLRIRQSPE